MAMIVTDFSELPLPSGFVLCTGSLYGLVSARTARNGSDQPHLHGRNARIGDTSSSSAAKTGWGRIQGQDPISIGDCRVVV